MSYFPWPWNASYFAVDFQLCRGEEGKGMSANNDLPLNRESIQTYYTVTVLLWPIGVLSIHLALPSVT
uniref:Uncharacterized protein n=1 Tax=Anguilla anguilla TaxID=7936 RepID=A0A0E9RP11_ANGAN